MPMPSSYHGSKITAKLRMIEVRGVESLKIKGGKKENWDLGGGER